jgi:hypothetical protein
MQPLDAQPLSLSSASARFDISLQEKTWMLTDLRAGVTWGGEKRAATPPIWMVQQVETEQIPLTLASAELIEDGLRCRFSRLDGGDSGLALVFRLAEHILRVYLVPDTRECPQVTLFFTGLSAGAGEGGEALIPVRMGLLVPAQGEKPFEQRFGTYDYEGAHMAMAGLFKSGAALMAAWQDPYIAVHLSRRMDGETRLEMGFELSKTARSLELHCLGKGDYHTVAEAYRARAAALEYRVPWSEKLRDRPQAARLFGAANFKLWTALARRVDENTIEQSVDVRWTFNEVAQIAEHLQQDLKLDDVLFHLGGWSTYGYDCRHPDIMPANPECGGDAGLADCARRVQNCGYLFCLHDNYQDMYRDAPSWDEASIQKQPDGALQLGGVWLGGRAYITCSREALKLAQRPQNLEKVHQVAHPDVYFIDTTYAAGLQECIDPRHPLTKQDDMRWKQALSDYARDVFGLFGSECGREWAVPHADFFEGLSSVSGRYFHILKPEDFDARVVPVFDMVFHDCIVIHGKYGYEPAEMAEQVIHHAAIGRTLYYHSVDSHLYWQDPTACAELPAAQGPLDPALYTRADNGWAEGFCLWDRFMKNTQEILGPLNLRTSQALIDRYDFLDTDRLVRRTTFSNGVKTVVNGSAERVTVASRYDGELILPPYGLLVEADDFLAFVAEQWNGRKYAQPVLFTLTALDGQPLERTHRLRVYHGFGESALNWNGQTFDIRRERIVERGNR